MRCRSILYFLSGGPMAVCVPLLGCASTADAAEPVASAQPQPRLNEHV
jgi:hypothetical protein